MSDFRRERMCDTNSECSGKSTEQPPKSRGSRVKKTKAKRRRQRQHSLDHLTQRVSDLMSIYEERGLFVPLPESQSEKGKVWSNRNYGADKKRQRKNAERQLLLDRVGQLERCLKEEHGIADFVESSGEPGL
mmetsp:Transcript_5293/g.15395  ORF Transcript_5293/g.15395 Transcript_5293/m.15395 type:complete len:132 (-) Transcript_5293:176-571(-)